MSITVLGRRDVKKRQELGGGSLSLKGKERRGFSTDDGRPFTVGTPSVT